MTSKKDLREWLFRGLMFESDADKFRGAGITIGADTTAAENAILKEVLSPFPLDLRNEAMRMGRLYILLYCFENSVREVISSRLQEKYGSDWWKTKVPRKIREFAESRQRDAKENSWLEGQTQDSMGFIEFGHLSDIVTENWEDFSDLIPSQHWLKQRMDELEKTRNFIAHHRFLLPGEFQRIEMYIADWNRMVGL